MERGCWIRGGGEPQGHNGRGSRPTPAITFPLELPFSEAAEDVQIIVATELGQQDCYPTYPAPPPLSPQLFVVCQIRGGHCPPAPPLRSSLPAWRTPTKRVSPAWESVSLSAGTARSLLLAPPSPPLRSCLLNAYLAVGVSRSICIFLRAKNPPKIQRISIFRKRTQPVTLSVGSPGLGPSSYDPLPHYSTIRRDGASVWTDRVVGLLEQMIWL